MIDPRPEICQTASGKFDLPPYTPSEVYDAS